MLLRREELQGVFWREALEGLLDGYGQRKLECLLAGALYFNSGYLRCIDKPGSIILSALHICLGHGELTLDGPRRKFLLEE
jgi:hypothetical protein